MRIQKIFGGRFRVTSFCVLSLLLLLPYISVPRAAAKSFTEQTLVVGSGLPSANTSYNFSFTVKSLDNIGSIVFEYCSNSSIFGDVCVTPSGVDVTGANLVFQSGNEAFSVNSAATNNGKLVIERTPSAAAVINSKYHFTNIINPSVAGTVFVRISTYSSIDGSGSNIDDGAVAYAVNSAFVVGAYVPPFLSSCAGLTVTANCSNASGTLVELGTLSASKAGTGTSQFAAATNSPTGIAVYGLGTTLTSGNNQIDSLSNNSFSAPGTSQFGINLRSNVLPQVGTEPSGPGSISPTAGYGAVNQFRFDSGEVIANSSTSTDYKTFTVSYLANIPRNMPGGYYATSITYLAVAEF